MAPNHIAQVTAKVCAPYQLLNATPLAPSLRLAIDDLLPAERRPGGLRETVNSYEIGPEDVERIVRTELEVEGGRSQSGDAGGGTYTCTVPRYLQ